MPKFLVDEDLPRSLARELRLRGLQSEDVRDIGLRGAPDQQIWDRAVAEGWTLVSGDLGFANALQYPLRPHEGVIVGRFPTHIASLTVTNALVEAIRTLSEDDIRGNLIIVEPGRVRLRLGH